MTTAAEDLERVLRYAGVDDADNLIEELKRLHNDAINHEALIGLYTKTEKDLVAARESGERMHRRAQQLEGAEARVVALRASNLREVQNLRMAEWHRRGQLKKRLRDIADQLRAAGVDDAYYEDGVKRPNMREGDPAVLVARLLEAHTKLKEERLRLGEVVDAISEATMTAICDDDIVEHILRDHAEPEYVASHYRDCAKRLNEISGILSRYCEAMLEAREQAAAKAKEDT